MVAPKSLCHKQCLVALYARARVRREPLGKGINAAKSSLF